ncbi:hypothetical protein E2C01_049471 [Portunus trituberculatus]|uniref:Uncharacterized protein n=1 Tax=Portunus trituberculatus TaxID=210409 RepID=A0A5B7G6G7_PORTR|nr:hypothetical protein [Portunus trituberculatus]
MLSSQTLRCWVRLPAAFVEATRVEICFRPSRTGCGLWRPKTIPIFFLPLKRKELKQVSGTEFLVCCSQGYFSVDKKLSLALGSCVIKLKKAKATLIKVPADVEDVADALTAGDGFPLHISFTPGPVISRMQDCDTLETTKTAQASDNHCSGEGGSEEDGDSHSGVSSSSSLLVEWRRGAEKEDENRNSHSGESTLSSLGDPDHYMTKDDERNPCATDSGGESGYEAQDDSFSPASPSPFTEYLQHRKSCPDTRVMWRSQ